MKLVRKEVAFIHRKHEYLYSRRGTDYLQFEDDGKDWLFVKAATSSKIWREMQHIHRAMVIWQRENYETG